MTGHTYGAAGEYTAVVVANSITETFTATTFVTVDEAVSGLTADNDGPTPLGSPTTLSAAVTAGSNVVYTWSFGDGSNGSGASPGHSYPAAGIYTATVTAQNSVGMETAETVVVVEETISGLTASNDGPTALGSPTTLMASVTAGSNVVYSWDFGDGGGGSGPSVTHTYAEPGMYTAVVTATNILGSQVAVTMVVVEVTEFYTFLPAVVGKPQ
jgi:PKD repeat protein